MDYVLFAGANGSGKTTLIKNLRSLDAYQGFVYICADEIEKDLDYISDKLIRMKKARDVAVGLRYDLLEKKKDIIYESVASHPSHLDDLDRIRRMGYKIFTVYVTTESPTINLDRISRRGRDNDKYLTAERVTNRYYKSLELLSEIIKRSDVVIAYDNSINYCTVFYKEDGVHYIINNKSWADTYVVKKLEREGIGVLDAADLDPEQYLRITKLANSLIDPENAHKIGNQNA